MSVCISSAVSVQHVIVARGRGVKIEVAICEDEKFNSPFGKRDWLVKAEPAGVF